MPLKGGGRRQDADRRRREDNKKTKLLFCSFAALASRGKADGCESRNDAAGLSAFCSKSRQHTQGWREERDAQGLEDVDIRC